jgi:hypothetical protein
MPGAAGAGRKIASMSTRPERLAHCVLLAVLAVAAPASVFADDRVETRGTEVIEIEGAPPPPAVSVQPKKRYLPSGEMDNIFLRPAPRYSDDAVLSDKWSVAWMLLDIDEKGVVTRVKFLKYPGLELEKIAVETAMKLQFEPAKDADGKAVRSFEVWPIEWPSYWWLVMRTGVATGIPDTSHVPCRGSGPLNLGSLHPTYRDCSSPDLALAKTEPWLTTDDVKDKSDDLKSDKKPKPKK